LRRVPAGVRERPRVLGAQLAAADVSVARAGDKAVYLPHAIAVGAESVVNRAYCLDGLHGRGYRYPQRRGGPPSVRMAVPEWLLPGWRVPHAWIALGDRLLVSTVHAPSILSELRGTPTFVVLCQPSSKHGRQGRFVVAGTGLLWPWT